MTRQSNVRRAPPESAASCKRTAADLRPNEGPKLEQRIVALEGENAALRAENRNLRRQKNVYV